MVEFKKLSLAQAIEKAPAIAAKEPASYINRSLYHFTSTEDIISHMDALGWGLVEARQSSTKKDLRKNYGTHIVKFQHPELYMKDEQGQVEGYAQVTVINSHDGTTPITFDAALHRKVCSNGLIVKAQEFQAFRERHTKYGLEEVKLAVDTNVKDIDKAVQRVNVWLGRQMTAKEQFAFATEALALRLSTDRKPEQYELLSLLESRRPVDSSNDLWHVFNRVQENLIKGGFQFNERQARPITNPMLDHTLNGKLWQIAEKYSN